MKMLLDIIGEQKEKLELQEKNIRYTSVHIEREKQYPEKIFVDVQEINAWFEPVEIREDNTFIINYLTDGFRSGTCFSVKDLTVCGRYREEVNQTINTQKQSIRLSGKCVSLYAFGWPKNEIIAKTVSAAEKENIQPTMIFCEMILENISPDKCLFRYFAQEHITWKNE